MAVVLGLAAVTRLRELDLAQFKLDDAMALSLAIAIREGSHYPLTGIPSSVGVTNPPLLPYLLALPLFVWRDVLAPIAFVGLMNVAAVGLTFVLLRRHFHWAAALVGGALFAVGYWPVFYSRFLWAQNFLPAFSAAMGLCVYEAVVRGRRPWYGVAALLVGLMAQLHFSGLALVPLVLLVGVLFRRRLGAALFWGVGLLLLPFLPYAAFDLFSGSSNIERAWALVQRPASWQLGAWRYLSVLLGHQGFEASLGEANELLKAATPDLGWSSRVEAALLLAGMGLVAWRVLRPKEGSDERTRYGLLALWVAMPPLVFARASYPVYDHYFLIVLPALFAVVGIAVGNSALRLAEWAALHRHPVVRGVLVATLGVVAVLVAAVVGAQFLVNTYVLDYTAQGLAQDARGVPVGRFRAALRELARAQAETGATSLWIIPPSETVHHWGTLTQVLEPLGRLALGVRTLEEGETLVWRPSSPVQLYLTLAGSGSADRFLRETFPEALWSQVPGQDGRPFLDVFAVSTVEMQRVVGQMEPVDMTTTRGVRVLGVQYPRAVRPASVLPVAIHWSVVPEPRERPRAGDRFAVHLVREPFGLQSAQQDGIGYPSGWWQPGDHVLSWYPIVLPETLAEGEYYLRVGMYDLGTMERASFVGADGTIQGEHVVLGPLRVCADCG